MLRPPGGAASLPCVERKQPRASIQWRNIQADLAGRDFAAERGQSVVVSTGGAAIGDLDREMGSEARAVAEVLAASGYAPMLTLACQTGSCCHS